MDCTAVALKKLVNSSSHKVREKAAGALWILDNRDQQQGKSTSTVYVVPMCVSWIINVKGKSFPYSMGADPGVLESARR